jgi:hypothetical protein
LIAAAGALNPSPTNTLIHINTEASQALARFNSVMDIPPFLIVVRARKNSK